MMIHWNPEVPHLSFWANRLNLPLDHSILAKHYIAAHKLFREIKEALVADHGFVELDTDSRLLFSLEFPKKSCYRGMKAILSLPHHVSSFFTPDRKLQWEMIFHSAPFQNMRSTCAPLARLFYLLQALIPGMFMLVKKDMQPDGQWTTSRALPPPDWLELNNKIFIDVFNAAYFRQLFKGAQNANLAFEIVRD